MATMKLGSKSESSFQLEGQTWVCQNELASDVVIQVGEMSFHLHKFPLLNRSGLLKKLISEARGGGEDDGRSCTLQLHDVPGGAKSFELVAKFCYDVRVELTALNVVPLRCAAEHLRMTEEHAEGNLVAQTESFLNEVFGSWKDSVRALGTCGDVAPQAEDLHIVTRCINSLAAKACADPSIFSWPVSARSSSKNSEDGVGAGVGVGGVLWNGIRPVEKPRPAAAATTTTNEWWYEDASFLSLPLYKRLMVAVGSKGMKPESIAGSLTFYAKRHLPGLSRSASLANPGVSASSSAASETGQRSLLEEIVGLLPAKKGVASTKFLLRLLRTAMILRASASCRDSLERRVGAQLDDAALEDLLIPNLGYSVETLYDIDCIQRVLDHFMLTDQASAIVVDEEGEEGEGEEEEEGPVGSSPSPSPSLTPMTMVAKLVDGYLAEVAPDVNLKFTKFQSLASMIPDHARPLDDGIYRAIDIYLKSHPWLTESEREQLCRLMNCQKLSLEACTHAAQNERLPLRVVVQVLFFEQLRLRTSIAGWFFVSDSVDSSHGSSAHTKPVPPKNNDETAQEAIAKVNLKDSDLSVEEMKLRVSELEKECLSMKKEIEKLGQTKSSGWSVFSKKFGFGLKSQNSMNNNNK